MKKLIVQYVEKSHEKNLRVESAVYFDQTRDGDCWNSGKNNQDGFDEFVSVEFE